jgi:4-hydroxythreonine-4-phosphate dehydrogenase
LNTTPASNSHATPAIPVVALTPGEPAGVGPDLCLQAIQKTRDFHLVLLADPDMLRARAAVLGLSPRLVPWDGRPRGEPQNYILAVRAAHSARPGQLDAANAAYVLETLKIATRGCLSGEFDALVTGPVHKGIINDAGYAFSGHTEFLAHHSGGAQPVMMLTCPGLRVALATTHLPLADVSRHITHAHVARILRVLHHDLRVRFGINDPTILVCGLNPHAGEGGHLGREEIDVIEPVLHELRGSGLRLRGPVPADTAFLPAQLATADAVLAMYHDQGLPVLKARDFAHAVNVTLGLPLIRTSVDHGTALELAGTGRADDTSLRAALDLAVHLARQARTTASVSA